jgi:hypothetical protein
MHVLLEIISIFWTFQLQQSPSNMLHISSWCKFFNSTWSPNT